MRTPRHSPSIAPSKKIAMTLGDFISAAYDASDGFGGQRVEHAVRLLTESSLARHCSRQLRFVR